MPHCIVEHASSIQSESLIPLVFSGALDSGLFEPDGSDIKVRSIAYDGYLVGGQKSAFIHVVLKILAGRTDEQKKHLSKSVLEQLAGQQWGDCSITVEVAEMDRASYQKWLSR